MGKYKSVRGVAFGKEVAEKLGLENARRIILDIQINSITVYAELNGDERLYNIDMDTLPTDIKEEIETVEVTQHGEDLKDLTRPKEFPTDEGK